MSEFEGVCPLPFVALCLDFVSVGVRPNLPPTPSLPQIHVQVVGSCLHVFCRMSRREPGLSVDCPSPP